MYSFTFLLLYSCIFVLLYSCILVLLYFCSLVHVYSYTLVLVYSCTLVLLYSCKRLYSCTLVILHSCTLVLLITLTGREDKILRSIKCSKSWEAARYHDKFSLTSYRPSKCPIFYATKIPGAKEFMPKRAYISAKLKLRQIVVIFKMYTKMHNFNKKNIL